MMTEAQKKFVEHVKWKLRTFPIIIIIGVFFALMLDMDVSETAKYLTLGYLTGAIWDFGTKLRDARTNS